MDTMSLELKAINTIRTLAMDAVQAANSGHPGTPMALAPLAYLLYIEEMRHNPANPHWAGRDRFILSAGHASMLQYALLHLTGYELTLDDLKAFRQWQSKTPGHPEVHHTPGIETTTGPLGQGISTAVGMALGERRAAALYNTEDHTLIDHYTYVIASDGDLMEGVAQEAISLAGHLKLGKLICYYDDNSITIDGRTDLSFSEDVAARFEACGWHTLQIDDINDLDALRKVTAEARAETERPTLISVRTIIGYGSPNKQDTSSAHGSPLGEAEVALSKKTLGWPEEAIFLVPEEVRTHMDQHTRGQQAEEGWTALHTAWAEANPTLAAQWARTQSGALPEGWDQGLPTFTPEDNKLATRKSSQQVLKLLHDRLPELCGGSADLAGSNGMKFPEMEAVKAGSYSGPVLHFGIREHGMGAISSGLSLYGGSRVYCATFLVFTDYMRASIRLAALMHQPVIYVMTHDSIGLGEDGPTHQPVEHMAALRAIPNLDVLRPGDGNETREAWRYALQRTDGPTML
ncbi:MAG: transketolase, partial [Myxococcota bacterium]